MRMKTHIHQRFYAARPRPSAVAAAATSSSTSSSSQRRLHTAQLPFFDSASAPKPPPSPQARPRSDSTPTTLTTTQHSPSSPQSSNHQGQGQTHPALALPNLSLSPDGTSATGKLPSSRYGPPYAHPAFSPSSAPSTSHSSAHQLAERRFRLDVGAYGVPKRGRSSSVLLEWDSSPSSSGLGLATQVGEDAYFIRPDALGVADGVGGWATRSSSGQSSAAAPTASALFARRLMHQCASEFALLPSPPPPPPTTPQWFSAEKEDDDNERSSLYDFGEDDLLSEEEVELGLDAALEDLSDGLDVLHLLERAYDGAIKTHVVPAPSATPAASSPPPTTSPPPSSPQTIPLMAGSSTALLAVLDHAGSALLSSSSPSPHPHPPKSQSQSTQPSSIPAPTPLNQPPRRTPPSTSTSLFTPIPIPIPRPTTSPTTQWSSTPLFSIPQLPLPSSSPPKTATTEEPSAHPPTPHPHPQGALLHIAHLGDSAALLVRHGKVVWRTEEMWWGFNTPAQLGPTSPARPLTHARAHALQVRPGDVLVLASDGLVDNVWEEEVGEVVGRVCARYGYEFTGTGKGEGKGKVARSAMAQAIARALVDRALERCRSDGVGRGSPATETHPSAESGKDGQGEEETPFARRAREAGKVWRGGKNDDVTVLVAIVAREGS